MVVAGQWYQSGTFWTAAGVAATLLVGIGTIIVAFLSYNTSKSKRFLDYYLMVIADLGHYLPAGDSEIQIIRGTERIDKPHLVEIRFKYNGRSDISAADWDGGKPMKIDVHVPIVSMIEAKSFPAHYSTPEAKIGGSIITLEPGLIRRNQEISFTVLVDGYPRLSVDSHIINVKVSARTPFTMPLPPTPTLFLYSVLVCAAIIISAFLDLAKQTTWAVIILLMLLIMYLDYLWTVLKQHREAVKEAQRQSYVSLSASIEAEL